MPGKEAAAREKRDCVQKTMRIVGKFEARSRLSILILSSSRVFSRDRSLKPDHSGIENCNAKHQSLVIEISGMTGFDVANIFSLKHNMLEMQKNLAT